eukprot:CAMPEP_0198116068 /NCGR_PEP_ID=MMETSP1442-20131203/9430_1 /TAXON_ID= /ORGANISM="Craspedostauros australis, Strain CCMP3328" /LENGTH=354 /DNA_ID=CAMNT_0043773755 /DNA_START=145 /DNA_END=1209 /DNA_ORIENTATION=+
MIDQHRRNRQKTEQQIAWVSPSTLAPPSRLTSGRRNRPSPMLMMKLHVLLLVLVAHEMQGTAAFSFPSFLRRSRRPLKPTTTSTSPTPAPGQTVGLRTATTPAEVSDSWYRRGRASSTSTSNVAIRRAPIGLVKSLDRSKIDTRPDSMFYTEPKFVIHIDSPFVQKLKATYQDHLVQNGTILDLCSSHVSHLPTTLKYRRVDVHGMNLEELRSNPWRSITQGQAMVRDFNDNPSLMGLDSAEYDAVLCTVGIQYIQNPEAVLAEVRRVLKPNTGKCIISFSNRFFYQKALTGWIERGMLERTGLIKSYFAAAGGYDMDSIEVVGDGSGFLQQLMSAGGIGGDPFVAVIATADGE